jgi:cytochrome b6-f complex iron-sulfur subunit
LGQIVLIVSLLMDGSVETSNMDTVQDANQKVEGEEKQNVTATADKATPPAPKASASPDKPKAAAKPVGSSAGAKGKTVESAPPDPVNQMRRRIVWTAVGATLLTNFFMFLRFFLPRTIFEPPTKFKVGYPADFGFGVDTKFQQQYRIWVVRNAERLFVIYARCTHLGCTPDWKPGENKFKCPCHGSGYTNEGINFEGPAPRPMDRAHVELDPTGQIEVNTAKLYEWPKGEKGHFDESGAYISV